NSVDSFMDKIKKESVSESFCEGVINLTIDSFSESDFLIIKLNDLGVDITVTDEDFNLSIKNNDCEIFSETPVINYFTEELTIENLHFSAVSIEYLAIFNEGVAYIFNINSSNPNTLFNDIKGGGGSNKIRYPYLNCNVKKIIHKCIEVKACEYTNNSIKNVLHCEVNENKDFL
ncbi:4761_t:CDS:2, partial [Racocetra persica]